MLQDSERSPSLQTGVQMQVAMPSSGAAVLPKQSDQEEPAIGHNGNRLGLGWRIAFGAVQRVTAVRNGMTTIRGDAPEAFQL